jgi:hypothetical protein
MCRSLHRVRNLLRHALRQYADPLDQLPGKRSVHEEFRLLALFHIGRTEVGSGHCRPIHLIELIEPRSELHIDRARIRERERPPTSLGVGPCDDLLEISLQVDDRGLAARDTRAPGDSPCESRTT